MKISMKQFMVAMLGCLLLSAGMAQAAVVETIDVPNEGAEWYYVPTTSAAGQWFTVPAGQTCTNVAIRVMIGGAWNVYSGHSVVLRLKDGDGVWHTQTNVGSDFGPGGELWMQLSDLSLPAGSYHAQVLTNSTALDPALRLFKEETPLVPDYYSAGYAATGWAGDTAVGENIDFQAEITVVPEPATLVMLLGGMGTALIRRRR